MTNTVGCGRIPVRLAPLAQGRLRFHRLRADSGRLHAGGGSHRSRQSLTSSDPSPTHPIALKLRPRRARGGLGRLGGRYGRHGRGRFSDSSRWRHRGGASACENHRYCDCGSEDQIFQKSHCCILHSGPGAPVNARGQRRIENSSPSKVDGSAVAVGLRKWLPRNFSTCSSWWWTDSCYPAHRRSWMSTQAARSSWTHKNRLVSRTSRNSAPVRE